MGPIDAREETIRRLVDAWNADDIDGLLATMTPDVELHTRLSRMRGEPWHGHEGAREWFRDTRETFDGYQVDLDELCRLDDRILGLGRVHWRAKGSGIRWTEELGFIVGFSGDAIAYFDVGSRAEALDASSGEILAE